MCCEACHTYHRITYRHVNCVEHLSSSATSSASSSRQNSGTGFRLDGSGRGRDWYTGRMRRQSSGKDTEESSDASVSESGMRISRYC